MSILADSTSIASQSAAYLVLFEQSKYIIEIQTAMSTFENYEGQEGNFSSNQSEAQSRRNFVIGEFLHKRMPRYSSPERIIQALQATHSPGNQVRDFQQRCIRTMNMESLQGNSWLRSRNSRRNPMQNINKMSQWWHTG